MSVDNAAEDLAKRLVAVSADPVLGRKAAARLLAELDPTDAAEALHVLIRKARAHDASAQAALLVVSSALSWEAREHPHAPTLRRLAQLQDYEEVALLFAEEPARQVFDAGIAAKKNAQTFSESLGHLKTKARLTKSRDEIAKLATHQDPSVIANLLINPRLTEDWVIRIAARRPARPEPLMEVWKNPRWAGRPDVRRALVFNPYFPPELAAKVIPLLGRKDLEEVSRDNALAEALRRQAKLLLESDAPPQPVPVKPVQGPLS